MQGGTRAQTLIATVVAVGGGRSGPTGVVLLIVAGSSGVGSGSIRDSRLGGASGDVYGAVNELATMAMLVAASLLVLGVLRLRYGSRRVSISASGMTPMHRDEMGAGLTLIIGGARSWRGESSPSRHERVLYRGDGRGAG